MDTKKCPQCAEEIELDAVKCKFCGADLPTEKPAEQEEKSPLRQELNDPKIALLLSLIFSPIFGAYFNFKTWNTIGDEAQRKTAKFWMVGCIAGTVVFFCLLNFWIYYALSLAALGALFYFQTKPLLVKINNDHHEISSNLMVWKKTAIAGGITVLVVIVCCFVFGGDKEIAMGRLNYEDQIVGEENLVYYYRKDNRKGFSGKVTGTNRDNIAIPNPLYDAEVNLSEKACLLYPGYAYLKNGLLHGEVKGKIQLGSEAKDAIFHFKNGRPHGKQETKTNGRTHEYAEYSNGVIREYSLYSKDGKIQKHETYDKDGRLHGIISVADTRVQFVHGLKEGILYTYYENGKVESETTFHQDEPTGEEKKYFKSGKLASKVEVQGEIETKTEYYENGQISHIVKSKPSAGTLRTIIQEETY